MKLLPSRRWARALTILVMLAVYSAIMWWTVFPWVDRTYVNRPAFEETTVGPSPTSGPTTTPSTTP